MSDYQTKPGNGAIFKNDKKEKETEVEAESVQSEDFTSQIIVDVRTPQEFRSGAVPNAVNIP